MGRLGRPRDLDPGDTEEEVPCPALARLAGEHPAPAPCDPDPDPLACVVDGLPYRLDALLRHGKKSVLSVRPADGDGGPPLMDRADLYSFRSRRACAQLVVDAFVREVSQVLGHLALLLDQTERAQASEPRAAPGRLSPERQAAAEAQLLQPRLLDRAAAVMGQLGYVGEEVPKRLAFLVATSRLLARPLSAIVFAPSGSGKSELLETVARLVPEEAVEFLSRLTRRRSSTPGPSTCSTSSCSWTSTSARPRPTPRSARCRAGASCGWRSRSRGGPSPSRPGARSPATR